MKNYLVIMATILVIVIAKVIYFYSTCPDRDSYQAVFLENGNSFYGKLDNIYSKYATLSDVYYLKTNRPTIDPETGKQVAPKTPYDLVKLGNEIHGPEDEIHINKKHIMYWVNIKDTGNVAQAIQSYTQQDGASPVQTPSESSTEIKE